METTKNLRALYLAKILYEQTDEDHPLSTNQLIEALQNEFGISAHRVTIYEDMEQLRSFGVDIYRDKNNDYKQRFVGYRFNHILKVEFESDNDRLGKILYALANCKVRPEFRISYTVKDPEAAKNLLLGKAVTDAKEKAVVLTQAGGVTLKDIQSIDYSWGEIDFEYRPMRGDVLMECCEAPMAKSYSLDIEPDYIDVSDTVTVVWEIG